MLPLLYVVVPPSTGSSLSTDIINDIVVIVGAGIVSWFISVSVVKNSMKLISSAFNPDDLLIVIKRLLRLVSEDDEVKKYTSSAVKSIGNYISENPELVLRIRSMFIDALQDDQIKNSIKKMLLEIINDDNIRENAKKSLIDIVEQYPVLKNLLGGRKNAKKVQQDE